MDYFYIKTNPDWTTICKYGYVEGNDTNVQNRIHNSMEEHPERSTFTHLFGFEKTPDYKLYTQIDKIISHITYKVENIVSIEQHYGELPLLHQLHVYLVQSKTKRSTEFIEKRGIPCLLRVVREVFPFLGLRMVKEYSSEELRVINESATEGEPPEMFSFAVVSSSMNKWYERDYQTRIIQYGIEELQNTHKWYLELPTGGGKTYIFYKVLSTIKPDVIIIFSPRININRQNCNQKYLSLLLNKYSVFNCSDKNSFNSYKATCAMENKKMMIIACPQSSHKKIYEIIQTLSNITIWFDEAHHTIENWTNKFDSKAIQFLMEENRNIQNRMFSSASPNHKQIEQYPQYFGKLHSPIKVKELIDLKWLCPIISHIFSLNKENIDVCNYNLKHFEKYKCNFGFSFHNLRDSAYALFLEHYRKYKNNETKIRPYLLIGTEYRVATRIDLNYEYKNIEDFEKNIYSIGYVVQRYSMGYDFSKLDYIVFSDPKLSYSDIKQCIGRGIRSDGLGQHGQNLNKQLTILLPVFIDIDIDTDFNRIEHVLRYLVYDIEYPFDKLFCDFNESKSDKKLLGKKYDGEENMKAILLDLLRGGKYSVWKEAEFIKLLKNNNIHTNPDYNTFRTSRNELNLPEELYRCFPGFTWEQTYDESPYYSKEECIKKILELKEIHRFVDLEDEHYEPELYLNSFDPNIPPICLFRFYGGHNNKEFY